MTTSNSINFFSPSKWVVSKIAGEGTHTTISGAQSSASSGDTIVIMPGTYTENVTLNPGINMTALGNDSITPNVKINGTCTMTGAGSVTLSGIRFQTNSASCLTVSGSAASVLNLSNCYFNMTNNTGITFSSSSASSQIILNNCYGNLGTTGIGVFSHSSAGNLSIENTIINNSGLSSTGSTCSSGSLLLIDSYLSNPVTMSSSGSIASKYSEIDCSAENVTPLTSVGGELIYTRLASGTASPLVCNTGTTTTDVLVLNHTNSVAISGTGTLIYSCINQDSTIGSLTVSTLTPKGTIGNQSSTAPASGYIGEQIRGYQGTPQSLTTATPLNVTSINLTPGIWDISGICQYQGAGVTGTEIELGISANSASFTGTNAGDSNIQSPIVSTTNSPSNLVIPAFRVTTSAASTTYYLVAQATFTVGTISVAGRISATRVA
jgi:hypothetical protein